MPNNGYSCIITHYNYTGLIQNDITHDQVLEAAGDGTFAMKENEVYTVSSAIGGVERMEMGENEAYTVSRAVGGVERMEMGENEAYTVSRAVGGVERMEMGENEAYMMSEGEGRVEMMNNEAYTVSRAVDNELEAREAVEPTYEYIQ